MQTSDRFSSSSVPRRAIRKKMRLVNRNYPFYFVAGALVLYVVFFLIPALMGFYYAFTDWNSYSTDVNFVGLDNFRVLFSSHENYLSYVKNTLVSCWDCCWRCS
jgi:ABC-type sugar transport system permease subunit